MRFAMDKAACDRRFPELTRIDGTIASVMSWAGRGRIDDVDVVAIRSSKLLS